MLLALLLALAGEPAAAQNTGSCNGADACPWKCCRGVAGDPLCWCSRCCVVKGTDLGPDDKAQALDVGGAVAAVYRRRVEFRRTGDAAPRRVRRFEEGILPVEAGAFGDGRILICTSGELGVEAAAGAQRGFCGAYDRDGRELFRLAGKEAAGVTREAYAIAPGGREALFALTRPRQRGEREIVGYRLWRKGKPVELLPADGPSTRRVLESFEGTLVLPGPGQGN